MTTSTRIVPAAPITDALDLREPTIVTIARADDPGAQWPYYAAVLYRAAPRASDGVATYRRVEQVGRRTRSLAWALADAQEYCDAHDLPFVRGIRQGAIAS